LSPIDPSRARALLERCKGARILVVGDLMLDRHIVGAVERISPEAPVPVVLVQEERDALGGAGNVAANVTALGGACVVVGHVGADPEGDTVLRALTAAGVGSQGVVRGFGRPTTLKTRVLARHQQIVRFDREVDGDVGSELAADLVGRIEDLATASDVIVVQDYDKGVLAAPVLAAVQMAASHHRLPWIVDPKRRRFFEYSGATVFKPNAKELGDALGEHIHPDDPSWMRRVHERLHCDHLLVTLGERGMSLRTAAGEHMRLGASARGVYDVSGAGDTVTAAVAVALAAGAAVEEAAALANSAAALEVAKPGVQTVSAAELLSYVRDHQDHQEEGGHR